MLFRQWNGTRNAVASFSSSDDDLNFYFRLLAHSNDAEPSPDPPTAESATLSNLQTSIHEDTADASGQVSTTEVAKSMKCDM